jgi:DNA-binding CsgD family transcriptional regulator
MGLAEADPNRDRERGAALVGREHELALAAPRLDALASGRGGLLWIEGEAGIGKTALAEEIGRRATELGALSLRGWGEELCPLPQRLRAAHPRASARPRTADSTDARILDEIAALLGSERCAPGAVDPVRIAERVLDIADRRSARRPLLVTADNLQCADLFSLQMFNQLASASDQVPLLLVGICRPTPTRPPVERLRETVRSRGGVFVRPGPLPEPAAAGLVSRATGSPPGPRLLAELARAAGNPLLAMSLLRALIDEGAVTVREGVTELNSAAGTTPAPLVKEIGRWLECVSPEALEMLRTAALLGMEFDAGAAALATGLPVSVLALTIAQAEAAGVLGTAGGGPAFRHELIQQALAEQFRPQERRERHAAIARRLAAGGAGLGSVARQLTAASEALDDWALTWLSRVPLTALYDAPDAFARLLTRAVRATEPHEARWGELVARLCQVLLLLGRDAELIGFAAAAAGRAPDPALTAQLNTAVIRAALRSGRQDDAVDIAREALTQLDVGTCERTRLEAWQSVAYTTAGRRAQGYALAHWALAQARAGGDPLALAYAHHAVSLAAPINEGIGQIDQALAVLGSDPDSTDLRISLTRNRLIWLVQLGRMREYESALPGALALAERTDHPRATGLLGAAAEVALLHGHWDKARSYLDRVEPAHTATTDGVYLRGLGAIEALHRGEHMRAAAHLTAIEAFAGTGMRTPVPHGVYLFEAQALRAEADGDSGRALELLTASLAAPPGGSGRDLLDVVPHLMRLALETGETDVARRALENIETAAHTEPLGPRSAAARFCRAQYEDDERELAAVADLYRSRGWPLHAGAAYEEGAVRAARAGEIVRARAGLNQAVRLYAGIGAEWDVRRADARLRALGVRRGPRTRARQTTGWGALTTSELRIAGFVGEGWSNPDIAAQLNLSLRTVQTHVSNILAKLQLHSRLDIVRMLAECSANGEDGGGTQAVVLEAGRATPIPLRGAIGTVRQQTVRQHADRHDRAA